MGVLVCITLRDLYKLFSGQSYTFCYNFIQYKFILTLRLFDSIILTLIFSIGRDSLLLPVPIKHYFRISVLYLNNLYIYVTSSNFDYTIMRHLA